MLKIILAVTVIAIFVACGPTQEDFDRAQREQDKIDYPNGVPEGWRAGSMTGFGNH